VDARRAELDAARAAAEQEQELRLSAEERARHAAEERALWESLAQEGEHKSSEARAQYERQVEELNRRLDAELQRVTSEAQQAPEAVEATVEAAAALGEEIELDEPATRRFIDQQQLCAAGWEADSVELTHAKGARPEKGKNRAIAEWPARGIGPSRARRLRAVRRAGGRGSGGGEVHHAGLALGIRIALCRAKRRGDYP
jgi:type I restriction enzyme R subunit